MGSSNKILLVDDEENLLHLVTLMLMELGWEVASTSRPEEALCMMKSNRYLMALVDNQLGPIEGVELIGRMLGIDEDLPCVLMTGDLNVATTAQALEKGAAGFLRKPFRVEELMVSIEHGKRARTVRLQQKALRAEYERSQQEKRHASESR